jgi:predicted secreted protein
MVRRNVFITLAVNSDVYNQQFTADFRKAAAQALADTMGKLQSSFGNIIKGFEVIDIKFPDEHQTPSNIPIKMEIGIQLEETQWMDVLLEQADNPMRYQIIESMKPARVDYKLMEADLQLR